LNALPVEQAESGVFRCRCDGEIFPAQRLDQPILKAVHHDLPTTKLAVDLGMDFGGLVQCEAVAMRRVADHDVAAGSAELVGEALHLVHAVQFVIHGHHQGQNRAERLEHSGGFNFTEVFEKQLAGSGATIHNHEVRPLQRTEDTVELAPVSELEELHVRVKPLQSRILVVAINRDVGDALVFEELDEVDGEEAFANAAFAIEDKIKAFHVLGGLRMRTCAIRGPREGFCGVPPPTGFAIGSGNESGSFGCGEAGAGSPFDETDTRFRPGRRRGRTISPST